MWPTGHRPPNSSVSAGEGTSSAEAAQCKAQLRQVQGCSRMRIVVVLLHCCTGQSSIGITVAGQSKTDRPTMVPPTHTSSLWSGTRWASNIALSSYLYGNLHPKNIQNTACVSFCGLISYTGPARPASMYIERSQRWYWSNSALTIAASF